MVRGWTARKPSGLDDSNGAEPIPTVATAPTVDVAALLAELPMQQGSVSRALMVLDDPNASAADVALGVGIRFGLVRSGVTAGELGPFRNVGPSDECRPGCGDARDDGDAYPGRE